MGQMLLVMLTPAKQVSLISFINTYTFVNLLHDRPFLGGYPPLYVLLFVIPLVVLSVTEIFPSLSGKFNFVCPTYYCQPQAKAKAKAMPGRLYIHTK